MPPPSPEHATRSLPSQLEDPTPGQCSSYCLIFTITAQTVANKYDLGPERG